MIASKSRPTVKYIEKIIAHFPTIEEATFRFAEEARKFIHSARHQIGDALALKQIDKTLSIIKVQVEFENPRYLNGDNSNRINIRHKCKYDL